MKKRMLFLFLLCINCYAMAQRATISGTVIASEDDSSLMGVSVVVKGTTMGTVTGMDGRFSIEIPSDRAVLVFSFLGYATQEMPVSSNSGNLLISLKEDSNILSEVVVVGYGSMKKSDISGASISIGEDKIKGSIITNLDQALQGRAAGVSTIMTSGAPGSSASIQVRGLATINAGTEPLYVIDGVIVQSSAASGHSLGLGDALGNGNVSTVSPLSSINPSDILSMEILKDASATAIYGAQGSNGVVLITTKRGKAGEAKFSYEGMVGIQRQNKRLDMMNLREYAEFSASVAAETNSIVGSSEYEDPSLLGIGTNWQDAVFQHALIHQHQISAQGGTERIKYYVSGNYIEQEGTIIGTKFDRYSFRTNLDADLKKWLKIGVNAMYSSTSEQLGLANGAEGIINYSLLTPPDIPIYDIDGNYSTIVREGYYIVNPVATAMMNDISLDRNKLNGSIFLNVTPFKNLVWHSEFGFDVSNSKAETFYPTYDFGNVRRTINEMRQQTNNNKFYQVINNLTYSGQYDKHSYTLMVGQDLWESSWDYMSGSGTGLPSNEIHSLSLTTTDSQTTTSGFGSSSMSSFFVRGTYNFDDRYLATYTFRRDGSSNFGPKNRWASFNSFAASWRFSNEKFFQPLESTISNGKLRIGWGQTGNSDIGGYRWGSSISRMPSGLGMGYRQSNISNPYVHWETQEQWNLGLDIGLFKDRINLVLDLYDKTSKDMLMQLDLPSYMGTKGNVSSALAAPYGNFGEINNKGLEISLNTRNLTGDFEWDTDFQISFNKNKLVSLTEGTPPLQGYAQWGGQNPVSYTEPGQSLYNFYGFVTDGYYVSKEDIENSPKPTAYPDFENGGSYNRYNTVWVGDIKYKDISGPEGMPDGIIDDYDRTFLGSPFPKFTFGMNNTFRYKNIDLSIFLNGSYGNKVFNYTAIALSNMSGSYSNQLQYVTNRARLEPIDSNKTYDGTNGIWNWFEDIDNVRLANNPSAPRAVIGDPNENTRISDRYIEDGSYLRIKNIILGYTFPTQLVRKIGLSSLRVYANIQNLYTFTDYSGYDPEVGISTMSSNVYGLDYGRYPSPQSYTFGLNVSF